MKCWLKLLLILPLLMAVPAFADTEPSQQEIQTEPVTEQVAKPSRTTIPAAESPPRAAGELSLGNMVISLAIVIVVVIALGWAFKKLTSRLPGNRHIKIICAVPLGQRERLLVVEMQGKQRVLGVTPQSISFLFELENSLPEEKLASDFHTQLQSFLKK